MLTPTVYVPAAGALIAAMRGGKRKRLRNVVIGAGVGLLLLHLAKTYGWSRYLPGGS